jgi:hypothetical protein
MSQEQSQTEKAYFCTENLNLNLILVDEKRVR